MYLQRAEEAESRQHAEVQIVRDSRDEAQLSLGELLNKHKRTFPQVGLE